MKFLNKSDKQLQKEFNYWKRQLPKHIYLQIEKIGQDKLIKLMKETKDEWFMGKEEYIVQQFNEFFIYFDTVIKSKRRQELWPKKY